MPPGGAPRVAQNCDAFRRENQASGGPREDGRHSAATEIPAGRDRRNDGAETHGQESLRDRREAGSARQQAGVALRRGGIASGRVFVVCADRGQRAVRQRSVGREFDRPGAGTQACEQNRP